ncbi:acylphosphatase [Candidatus Woesearchaeota archaeon]|nr:acylphosphatase [Candidatus Woesearchaeota archaeon]
MPKQCSIVIKNHVQFIGYRGFIETIAIKNDLAGFVYKDGSVRVVCEGEEKAIKNFLDDLKKISPEVSIGVEDKIAFPKPFGRVIVNLDREIFERLDEGVKILGEIKENVEILGEMRDTQYESVSILKDIKKLLERKA